MERDCAAAICARTTNKIDGRHHRECIGNHLSKICPEARPYLAWLQEPERNQKEIRSANCITRGSPESEVMLATPPLVILPLG